jgi:hypothetical protein
MPIVAHASVCAWTQTQSRIRMSGLIFSVFLALSILNLEIALWKLKRILNEFVGIGTLNWYLNNYLGWWGKYAVVRVVRDIQAVSGISGKIPPWEASTSVRLSISSDLSVVKRIIAKSDRYHTKTVWGYTLHIKVNKQQISWMFRPTRDR